MNSQNLKENTIQVRQINLHEIRILFQKYNQYQTQQCICYQSENPKSTTQNYLMNCFKYLNVPKLFWLPRVNIYHIKIIKGIIDHFFYIWPQARSQVHISNMVGNCIKSLLSVVDIFFIMLLVESSSVQLIVKNLNEQSPNMQLSTSL